jgi:hypothetical protein
MIEIGMDEGKKKGPILSESMARSASSNIWADAGKMVGLQRFSNS